MYQIILCNRNNDLSFKTLNPCLTYDEVISEFFDFSRKVFADVCFNSISLWYLDFSERGEDKRFCILDLKNELHKVESHRIK